MNNRMHNADNPHQTNTERVLCLCAASLLRSPTCANVLYKEFGLNTRSAGLSTSHALIPVDKVLLKWADTVVVMETEQAEYVDFLYEKHGMPTRDIYNFIIPDEYEWNDPELVAMIKQRWEYKEQYAWN